MLNILDYSKFGLLSLGVATNLLLSATIPQQIRAVEANLETVAQVDEESKIATNSPSIETKEAVTTASSTTESTISLNESASPKSQTTAELNSISSNNAPQTSNISYQATDLQPRKEQAVVKTKTEAELLAAVPIDLDALCTSFPLNSRCRGYQPGTQPGTQPTQPVITQPTTARPGGGFAVTGKVGTLGAGVEITKGISNNLNARLGVNGLGFGIDGTQNDIYYNSTFSLFSVTGLADFYPFGGGGLRVTGGLAYQDNRIDAKGRPRENGEFQIGDQTFTSQEVGQLKAKASFPNSIAPYLGIGFGNPVRRQGLGFSLDLGVLFAGSPEVELRATNQDANQQLAAEIEKERKDLEDDLNGLSVYPVLSVGVSYGF
ncbi:MAG TPA: hypothetical protein V6D15_13045 [Oculatellaceae cyanobacterium]|jgi:hypothetical protein